MTFAHGARAQEASAKIKGALEGRASVSFYGEPIRRFSLAQRFYRERAYAPGWDYRASDALAKAIKEAKNDGLTPGDYHLNALEKAREANDQPAVELLSSDAFFLLASHLANGRTDVKALVDTWNLPKESPDYLAALHDALRSGKIERALRAFAPTAAEYGAFRKEYARYRAMASGSFPKKVAPGEILRAGMRAPRVAELRARMIAFGLTSKKANAPAKNVPPLDFAKEIETEETFDDDLIGAVKKFQRSANLIDDGVVGKSALLAINVSPAEREKTLRVNMERLRWLPKDLGKRYVMVNVPGFFLQAAANGKVEEFHEVVVGQNQRPTPIFSAKMQYMIFNPWWMAPDKLAKEDKLPFFREHPEKAEELGFVVTDRSGKNVPLSSIDWNTVDADNFPYRLAQKPGDLNALGKVKFIFPNPYNVYLHDTPARDLFVRKQRAFSSGCVRVKDPLDLAEWILKDGGRTRKQIDEAVESGKEKQVNLVTPLPVHMQYITNMLNDDGEVVFLNDFYGRDGQTAAALDDKAP
ncbi:MAG: L,D-transpeptidase family protein [Rickettsiales bacterium]